MRQGVLVILDGLGDRPNASLDARTPLEAAATPLLDRLASDGRCGLVDPLSPGTRVGTHVGAGVLMGLHPDDARRLKRGPVEAAGVGLPLSNGDVAFRCNLATVRRIDDWIEVLDRRAGRCSVGNDVLCAAIDGLRLGDVEVALRPATGHRAVLRLSGPGLSAEICDSDPGDSAVLPAGIPPCRPVKPGDHAAEHTAGLVAELLLTAHGRLDVHPVNRERERSGLPAANGIIARGAGQLFEMRNDVRDAGVRAAVVSAECTVLGLASLFGFTPVTGPEMTAGTDTDLGAKVERARAALDDHDLVFIHVKGTDLCAHDRLPDQKRAFIEQIDAALGPLVDDGIALAVSGDHSTDSNTGMHTADPVPSLMYWPGIDAGPVVEFGEAGCSTGTLGRITATEFLRRFLARS